MTDQLATPTTLNHVAYQTTDTGETHRFYTQVLGCRLVSCVQKDDDPTRRGDNRPWIHTFFAFGSGEIIAFFEIDGLQPPAPDSRTDWTRHLAFNVESLDDLKAWRKKLKSHGVDVSPIIDHEDGLWRSIYFPDPNGVNLELTYMGRTLNDDDAARATELVRSWTTDHGQQVPDSASTSAATIG